MPKKTGRTKGGRCLKKVIQSIYLRIQVQTGKHSVTELRSVYDVSRSGYYKWLKRGTQPNKYEQAQHVVGGYVADIHAHNPDMGYRQVRDTLELKFGLKLCDPTVWRSMQRLCIHGYTRKCKQPTSYAGLEHTRYSNVLARNFHSDAPMCKIVTDVTYLKHRGKWFYLAAYLDLFNNEIVEWELSDIFDNLLVMRPAQRLLQKIESTTHQVLLHSDQGVQYSSAGFCNLLSEYNVIQSM